jgi:ParB-like nuclease domain
MQISIENIIVPEGRRPLDPVKVGEIAESIKLLGQLAPIGLRRVGNVSAETSFEKCKKLELVFGEHRLAAAQTLGWKKIDAVEIRQIVLAPKGCQETYSDYTKLVEITENLHRAELTTQQRNEQIAAWVKLYNRNTQSPNSAAERPNSKPGPKPDPGVAAAAKMTGRTTKNIKEAIKSTQVPAAVKAAADAAELTSKQRLKISRLPEAEQLDAVSKEAAVNTKPNNAAISPAESDAEEESDEQRWQWSLSTNAGDAIAMRAFWQKEFGNWKGFDVPSSLVTLAKQAAKAWAELVRELAP